MIRFKHEDYYKFMAFFNNTRDEDTEADYPLLREYKTRRQYKSYTGCKLVETKCYR